jgi:UDP-GlcNAc3NAcA epimerase
MKLCIVVGARPNFIKVAPLITAITQYRKKDKSLSFFMIHTGQHYDENMSDVFFKEMGIPKPKYSLNIGSGSHGKQTGEMLGKIEEILLQEKPDMMVSIGDTNSTLAGALAAAKLNIPVSHIEAGLRLHDRNNAEEVNRVLTDHLASLNFVPTKAGKEFLLNEGFKSNVVFHYGDIMYDAALQFSAIADKKSKILKTLGLKHKEFLLATVHRAENTATIAHTRTILDAFVELSKSIKVVLPIHPRTKNLLVQHNLLDEYAKSIQIIEPLGYLDMLVMEKNAKLIVTDSGGVQKEAFFQGTPCIYLFTNTPWPELVTLGWNTVVPPKSTAFIVKNVKEVLAKKKGKSGAPYGKGNSAELMLEKMVSFVKSNSK